MNRFHILTLFPDMVRDGLNTSIIGRAIEAGHLEINAVNIRDYSTNKHLKVDDYPYGGGAGLVMQPEPIYRAYQDLRKKYEESPKGDLSYAPGTGVPPGNGERTGKRGRTGIFMRSL